MNSQHNDIVIDDCAMIYVAPIAGTGGVGDYSDDFIQAVNGRFAQIVQIRTPGPGSMTFADVVHQRRQLRRQFKELSSERKVIVHFELSAGSIGPFWLATAVPSRICTATVHDAPLGVWWPFRTKLIAKSRYLNHGIHFPLRSLSRWIEKWALSGMALFPLSNTGALESEKIFESNRIVAARHYIPLRSPIAPLTDRPRAIGLFGHAYKGKGFDKLAELRRLIDPTINIRVAGRGTESLERIDGVEVIGPVDRESEMEFFASVRCILLPYTNESRYGPIYSVSGVAARAHAYLTPVVALNTGALPEAERDGGVKVVDGDLEMLAKEAALLIDDADRLTAASHSIEVLRSDRRIDRVVLTFCREWMRISEGHES